MTPEAGKLAREILAAFPAPYVVIGSFASWLRGEVQLDAVADLDVLVPGDAGGIETILCHLAAHRFELRIWGATISRPVTPSQLAEKYYLRASRGSILQIDVTYDLAHLPFAETRREAVKRDGLLVCARETPRL